MPTSFSDPFSFSFNRLGLLALARRIVYASNALTLFETTVLNSFRLELGIEHQFVRQSRLADSTVQRLRGSGRDKTDDTTVKRPQPGCGACKEKNARAMLGGREPWTLGEIGSLRDPHLQRAQLPARGTADEVDHQIAVHLHLRGQHRILRPAPGLRLAVDDIQL